MFRDSREVLFRLIEESDYSVFLFSQSRLERRSPLFESTQRKQEILANRCLKWDEIFMVKLVLCKTLVSIDGVRSP